MKETRLEQAINEIEEYLANCKSPMFSGQTRLTVDKEQMDNLLLVLKDSIPDEIAKYRKIVENKDAILNDARNKAQVLINEAKAKTDQLVSEHEIMQEAIMKGRELVQQADTQAMEILNKSNAEADEIMYSAIKYTDKMLSDLGDIIQATVTETGKSYQNFMETVQQTVNETSASYQNFVETYQNAYNVILDNRKRLEPATREADAMDAVAEVNDISGDLDDLNFDDEIEADEEE